MVGRVGFEPTTNGLKVRLRMLVCQVLAFINIREPTLLHPNNGAALSKNFQESIARAFTALARVWRRWGDPGRLRYCRSCNNTVTWHPDRGCRECAWADRQW